MAKAIAVHKDADACHPNNGANVLNGEAWSSDMTSPGKHHKLFFSRGGGIFSAGAACQSHTGVPDVSGTPDLMLVHKLGTDYLKRLTITHSNHELYSSTSVLVRHSSEESVPGYDLGQPKHCRCGGIAMPCSILHILTWFILC